MGSTDYLTIFFRLACFAAILLLVLRASIRTSNFVRTWRHERRWTGLVTISALNTLKSVGEALVLGGILLLLLFVSTWWIGNQDIGFGGTQ